LFDDFDPTRILIQLFIKASTSFVFQEPEDDDDDLVMLESPPVTNTKNVNEGGITVF
jgi:hypothetical protein